MTATPRPWFAGYWGGQCRQPHFPHPGAEGGCVYEPIRHEFQQDDECGCMFAGIGAENGESVLRSSYEGLDITPDNLRFIVRVANAYDVFAKAIREVERLAIEGHSFRIGDRIMEKLEPALKILDATEEP